MNAILVELDVISIRHDHDYTEQSTGNTADNKEDLVEIKIPAPETMFSSNSSRKFDQSK